MGGRGEHGLAARAGRPAIPDRVAAEARRAADVDLHGLAVVRVDRRVVRRPVDRAGRSPRSRPRRQACRSRAARAARRPRQRRTTRAGEPVS